MAGRGRQEIELIGLTPDSVNSIVDDYHGREWDEPMSSFKEVNLGKLSSALKTPFLKPNKYNSFEEELCYKAALQFALIIEDHCFPQGNKRTAVGVLVNLGINNGYRFEVSEIKLYAWAMGVTMLSKYGLFEEAIDEVFSILLASLKKQPSKSLSTSTKRKLRVEFQAFMTTPL